MKVRARSCMRFGDAELAVATDAEPVLDELGTLGTSAIANEVAAPRVGPPVDPIGPGPPVDRMWHNPNRIPTAQGAVAKISPVRRRRG